MNPIQQNALQAAINAYAKGHFKAAFDAFDVLAVEGDADAQAWLASLYQNGEGVNSDLPHAAVWYEKAAQQGHTQAQTNLGAMLMSRGTPEEEAQGAHWIRVAAEHGDPFAQANLASLFAKGRAMAQDDAAATQWYRRAAEQGHYPSQARLGFCYATGRGVERDRVQAFAWLSLAAQHGVGTALNALENVLKDMSVEEKRAGTSMFDAWRSRTAAGNSPARLVPLPE
jgi:TPR repeat protein